MTRHSLLLVLIAVCQLTFVVNAKRAQVVHCDYTIAGAGAAGSGVAAIAKDLPFSRICVLERGPAVKETVVPPYIPTTLTGPDAIRQMNGMYLVTGNVLGTIEMVSTVPQYTLLDQTTLQPGRITETGYGLVVGGGANTNAAGDRVPARSVIDQEMNLPNFKWNDWKPDFDYIANEIGIAKLPLNPNDAPQLKQIAQQGFIAAGYFANPNMRDGNLLGSDGTSFCVTDQSYPINRTSTGLHNVENYEGKQPYPNLSLFSFMRADFVQLEGSSNRAKGVWATDLRTKKTVFFKTRREVILSSGTIRDAQILMRSGIYNRTVLRQFGIPTRVHNPNVGQNLWTHANMRMIYAINPDLIALPKTPEREIGAAVFGYGPVLNVSSVSAPNRWGIGLSQLSAPILPGLETVGLLELQAYDIKSRGSVTFNNASANAEVFLDYAFLQNPSDVALVRDLVMEGNRIMSVPTIASAYIQRLIPDANTVDLSNPIIAEFFARTTLGPAYHDGGTVYMGRSTDPKRVVDTRTQVVGTVGLRVCSSAIFPVPLRVNMASPSMALGSRCRRLILEDRSKTFGRRSNAALESADQAEENRESFQRQFQLDATETIEVPANYYNAPLPFEA